MTYNCFCPLCAGFRETSQNTSDAPSTDVLGASLVQNISQAAPANTIITKVISGDSRVDALLLDFSDRLNSTAAPGTPVTVTYSFPTQLSAAYSGDNASGWRPFSAQQQGATREVLSLLQKQINITFVEVNDTPSAGGTIRFSDTTQPGSAGYAYLANSSRTSLDSDVFISNSYSTNVTSGSYAWTTLVHELGHALGLKHPGNYNATQTSSSSAFGNFLGVNEDTFYNTIMTYRDSAQGINDTWFMPYDLLALRYLYGARAFETGNNTYTFTDPSGQSVRNIVDDGGTDTLDFSAVTVGAGVNLSPGGYSSVGKLLSGASALANVTLSLDAVIENVIGTAQADVIFGNAANNTLTGGSGNDTLDGGAGADTAVFSGPRARYTITKTQSGQTVRDNAGTDGTDTLSNMERLLFSDTKLALDLDGRAGQTVKLIGAVFGKASVANTFYVGVGLKLLDGGMSYEQLGTLAVNETGKTSAIDVVTLLWTNLIGSAPTSAQSAPYVAMLDKGLSAGALAVMAADSGINIANINLVGLAQTGVVYI
jgi:hypothetical protein